MVDSKLRIGFIGAGGIARGHFDRTHANENAEVVALCDISEKAIQAMHDHNPLSKECAVFSDWRTMLDQVEMDGVQIHTPHTLHFEQAMEALDRGLHVLCEKPMVCTVDHARLLIAKIEATGKTFGLSYQRHHQQEFLYIRDCLAQKKYGEITYITALQSQGWYNFIMQPGIWRGDPELSGGGQLNDSGSHLLDIILWCTGLEPQEVFAFIDNLDSRVDILTAASVKFTNGALGTIAVNGHGIGFYEDLTFYCDKGAFYMRQGKLTEQNEKNEFITPEDMPTGSDPDSNWIGAILGEADNMAPPICGLRVIQLTEAAWESGASGEPAMVKKL